jgi:hypothetical protein
MVLQEEFWNHQLGQASVFGGERVSSASARGGRVSAEGLEWNPGKELPAGQCCCRRTEKP